MMTCDDDDVRQRAITTTFDDVGRPCCHPDVVSGRRPPVNLVILPSRLVAVDVDHFYLLVRVDLPSVFLITLHLLRRWQYFVKN